MGLAAFIVPFGFKLCSGDGPQQTVTGVTPLSRRPEVFANISIQSFTHVWASSGEGTLFDVGFVRQIASLSCELI